MVEGNRIRVLLAGNVYAKRALVRRILEDAGYAIVGDVTHPGEVLEAVRTGRPDIVILDEDLVPLGVSLDDVRAASPDVRIVVSTSVLPGAGAPPPGADGYLDKGAGLSPLTALLGRLSAGSTPTPEPAAVGMAREVREVPMEGTAGNPGGGRGRAGMYRAMGIVAGLLLIVWGVVTAITAERPPRGERVAEEERTTGGGIVEEAPARTPLDRAEESLERMMAALREGNYVLAAVEAQSLMRYREQALAAGFSVTPFDAEVTARLGGVVADLPRRVTANLAEILGALFPVLEPPAPPTEGTSPILGTVAGVATGSGETGGGTETGGGGTETGGEGDTGGGGSEVTAPGPGDGRVWGQWHKEHKGPGGPPPWAKAKGHGKGQSSIR